jgi:deoxyribose-phosphate aldolase
MILTLTDFRKRIEYSLCQQFASEEDARGFCERARAANVGVACVNPIYVRLAAGLLVKDGIDVSGNVGFPFGSHFADVKVMETRQCVADGATQIDVVINVGALRSGKDDVVLKEIGGVVDAAAGRPVKVIIEAWVLNREEKERACRLVEKAGAQMVKTTTGVRTQYLESINPVRKGDGSQGQPLRGAELEDIALFRRVLGPKMKIKASGGIYDLDTALEMIRAGADQLGVSRGEQLIREFQARFGDRTQI